MDSQTTGIKGLDHVLSGGLTAGRMYLVEGEPGSGKTTLALQFLYEGARLGEVGLYLGLSETNEELIDIAEAQGWKTPPPFHMLELHPSDESLAPEAQYTIFHPSEVELGATTKRIMEAIETYRPQRIVVDSLSEMRLLAQGAFRFRRQLVALKHFLVPFGCTALLLDDRPTSTVESPVHTLSHGIISLEHNAPNYGSEDRRLRIGKLRGREFISGYHDLTIEPGGIQVFPRLTATDHEKPQLRAPLMSGIPAMDSLFGGGLDYGTSTLLVGPSGTGKSSIATHFAMGGIGSGHKSAVFIFDETVETFAARSEGLGLPVREAMDAGNLLVRPISPGSISPGEFACMVAEIVREETKLVVIDSLNGYLTAMGEANQLIAQLHELLAYNNQQGAITLLVMAQVGFVGTNMLSPVDASYLADNIVLFRYFEAFGAVNKALSVLKRRRGEHETTIRRLTLSKSGVDVGEPLLDFHGVLTGVPEYRGTRRQLDGEEQ